MLHTVLLISFVLSSLPVRPYWKESGFIGTCAGIGCLGRRNECAIYSISGPDGVRRTYHCYMD
jgi:hypothetical protein